MNRPMIKKILLILIFCMLACLCITTPHDNTLTHQKTTLQTEIIPYTYNATQNTKNFYFVEVFIQKESTELLRKISPYSPCNRISEYTVMGMDVSKSPDELEEYPYLPSLCDEYISEWEPFNPTEEITAYTNKKYSDYFKFSLDGCNYNILGGTEENCLDIISRFSAFPSLEEVYVRYRDGKTESINVIFTREKYTYYLETSFTEDLDGFAAMLTAMQMVPPDDNDFTQSLIEFMGDECLVPILLPSGYGPFTNAMD